MSRLFRVAVLTAVVTALSGCYTVTHTVVVNDDLTIDQHLITTVDTEQMGTPTSLSHDVASAVPSDPVDSEFETWWVGTFEGDDRLIIDEPGVPAIQDDPLSNLDDTGTLIGHSDAEIQRMQSYFGDRMTYRVVDEPPRAGFDLSITGMSLAEANEYPLSPELTGTVWALDDSGDEVTLRVTMPVDASRGAGSMNPEGLAWEQTFELPGTATATSHGNASGSVVSVSYAEAASGSTLVITSQRDGSDAWWSFAQPVIDAIEDTLGWTMLGIIVGGFVMAVALLMAARRRRRSGAVEGGLDEVAYRPAATQPTPQFGAGATFMPQGGQAAPALQEHQPLQGYPFQQGRPAAPPQSQPHRGYPPPGGQ